MPHYIPEGHHTVEPYLVVASVADLIPFLERAFDAKALGATKLPDGRIMHAEVKIGDSIIMMGEAAGQREVQPAMLHLYVPDADAAYAKAIAAGATSLREVCDQAYGDRSGGVKDPSGTTWWVSTHKEDVSEAELERRLRQQRK